MPKSTLAGSSVTIRTVAADAGVSTAAVSKVLRNAYGVSDALRDRVNASIERLGYRPKTAARGMRGRTFTVGLVVGDLHNPFLPDVVDGVQDTLGTARYNTLVGVGKYDTDVESGVVDTMLDQQMDGLILVAPRLSSEMIARYASRSPICVIAHHDAGAARFDTVNVDDEAGARQVVEHVVAQGHRKITMLSAAGRSEASSVTVKRENGYRQAMEAAGLRQHATVVRLDRGTDRSPDDFAGLLGSDRPDAIFCWSDLDAVHLLNAATTAGLTIPDDLTVIGFDNSPVAMLPQVALSSVDQCARELGHRAAGTLVERIEGRTAPCHQLVSPKLVVRRTG